MSKSILYGEKDKSYFSNIRWDIADLIPEGNHAILEIGCGNGATLKALKETNKACEIFGIEINEDFAMNLSQDLDRFFIGDVESIEPPFNEKYFDYIIYGDVLEHMIYPNKILEKYNKLLKDDGFIIASIPNIKFFIVLLRLIFFDEFKYINSGILDQSHLRFFTKKEIKRMFENEILKIIQIKPNLGGPIKNIYKKYYQIFGKLLPFNSFFTIQYIVKAKKGS